MRGTDRPYLAVLLLAAVALSLGVVDVCPVDDGCGEPVWRPAAPDDGPTFGTTPDDGERSSPTVPDCECCCAQIVNASYVSLSVTGDLAGAVSPWPGEHPDTAGGPAFHPPRPGQSS